MRIDELRVVNFRGFDEHEFTLHPQFNVLIGDNGTGKTAVLEALKIAIGSWFLGIKGQKSVGIRSGDVRLVGRVFAGEFSFEEQYPVAVTARGQILVSGPRPDEASSLSFGWKRALRSPNGRTTSRDANNLKRVAEALDVGVRQGSAVILPALAYYGTSRLWLKPRRTERRRKTPDKRELSRFVGYRDCIDRRLDPKDLGRWMERQSRIAWEDGEVPTLYRVVRRAVAEMVEEAADVRYDPKRAEVIVVFGEHEAVPFSYLSDGQRTMLALVGDLAMRMARLNPHLGDDVLAHTPGVVLIDEIDLHLHPTWQRHVVDDLKRIFPQVQFVTTTHSPFIVQTLDEGELISLDSQAPASRLDNLGIETISRSIMGVERPEQGPKYQHMVQAAKEYLLTLEEAKHSPEEELEAYKRRLAEAVEPFADNPAFQAFLELEREGKLSD
jgi:predicted ATP-binding protein involved in virulence